MPYIQKISKELNCLYQEPFNSNFREQFHCKLRFKIDSGKNIVILANGGSSAIASHFCTDLIKNLNAKASFIADHGLLTCLSNDYGYENSGVEYLKRFSNDQTLVVLISSSGRSLNIINAAKYCIKNSIECFGLAGFGTTSSLQGTLNPNHCFQLNSTNYNVIELLHLAVLLDAVEELMN